MMNGTNRVASSSSGPIQLGYEAIDEFLIKRKYRFNLALESPLDLVLLLLTVTLCFAIVTLIVFSVSESEPSESSEPVSDSKPLKSPERAFERILFALCILCYLQGTVFGLWIARKLRN